MSKVRYHFLINFYYYSLAKAVGISILTCFTVGPICQSLKGPVRWHPLGPGGSEVMVQQCSRSIEAGSTETAGFSQLHLIASQALTGFLHALVCMYLYLYLYLYVMGA